MRKLIFVMFALAMLACTPTGGGKGEASGTVTRDTVWNPAEISAVILDSTKADSTKVYDLNGDGKIDVSDVTLATAHNK